MCLYTSFVKDTVSVVKMQVDGSREDIKVEDNVLDHLGQDVLHHCVRHGDACNVQDNHPNGPGYPYRPGGTLICALPTQATHNEHDTDFSGEPVRFQSQQGDFVRTSALLVSPLTGFMQRNTAGVSYSYLDGGTTLLCSPCVRPSLRNISIRTVAQLLRLSG